METHKNSSARGRRSRKKRTYNNYGNATGSNNSQNAQYTTNKFSNQSNISPSTNNQQISTNTNTNRSQNNLKKKSQSTRPVCLELINELLEKTPEQIVLNLLNPKIGIANFFDAKTMDDELTNKMIHLIKKAFDCNSLATKLIELMNRILDSYFFTTHVYNLLNFVFLVTNTYNTELINCLLKIFCKFIYLSSFSVKKLAPFKEKLEFLILNQIKTSDLIESFQWFVKLNDEAEKRINKNRYKTFANIDMDNLEPSDDFTQMNVVPKLEDILFDQTPFLRKNLTNGAYKSVQHYLDVQFRLLREDFMLPLRRGVCKFREIVVSNEIELTKNKELSNDSINKIKKIENLNTYFDIYMENTVTSQNGIVYAMKLNLEKIKSINWETSKRLIFGSLVCFSSDYFQNDCLIGVICERNSKILEKYGLIYVRFNYEQLEENKYNIPLLGVPYIMLETSAYFESYKHVLKALISFSQDNETNFPFKENIVFCQNKIIPMPNYLRNAFIDFRPLLDFEPKITTDWTNGSINYEFSDTVAYAKKLNLTNQAYWPSARQMQLDDSQYEAVKLVLSNKLALIQGPPGTGKTFLGVKIIKLLLHNKHLWWNKQGERHKPILMICYTNHALDQFLECCIKECDLNMGVVRVGGRSKSENLEPYLLKNIKAKLRKTRKIDGDIHHRVKDELKKLNSIKYTIDYLSKALSTCLNGNGILSFDSLVNYMSENHREQIKRFGCSLFNEYKLSYDYNILEWLGFFRDLSRLEENLENLAESTFNKFENDNLEISYEDSLSDEEDLINIKYDLEKLNIDDNQNNKKQNQVQTLLNEENLKIEQNFERQKINETPKNADEYEEYSDEDSLNYERMLEDDYEILKEFRKIEKKAYKKVPSYQAFLNVKDIDEMISDYQHMNNIEDLDEKWQTHDGKKVTKKKLIESYLNKIFEIINNTDNSKEEMEILENESDISELSFNQKFTLYSIWLNKFKQEKEIVIKELSNQLNELSTSLQELRLQEDRSIMEAAFIIAMTTTGSSRYHSVLKDIGPRIVIVEEAAEVFEAHIVSSLSKNCEHLILIGDHVQLRPNPAVYHLAKDYNLDVSLFERLINNDIKKVMLTSQHRMRPEISLLMKHFYEKPIENHESVNSYENVVGIKKNIYFINHKQLEKRITDNTTKVNLFEASFLAKLCLYLTKQNYQETSITVLTMYLGQMMEIRNLLKNLNLLDIKVSTVDNYQGEENDIILLSLVRSNAQGRIGFLNVNNRICVALSRAKKGFYTIGNFDFICDSEKAFKWQNIVETLKENDVIGDYLTLSCGLHPQNDIDVSDPNQFDLRPDGGCLLPCGFRLVCGHLCPQNCHGNVDQQHTSYICMKKCGKEIKICGHKCQQQCSHDMDCNECYVRVIKIIDECGHQINIRCDVEVSKSICMENCKNTFDCGHLCTKKCSVVDCGKCETKIEAKSICKHESQIQVECSDKLWSYQNKCEKKCNSLMECGHICKKSCGNCLGGYIHANCNEKCERILFCGHDCPIPCSKQCLPCQMKCENRCVHSKCSLKCSDPCIPCMEKCRYRCAHTKCTKKCHELCDRMPCNKRCRFKLKCGHRCIGICGEPCVPLCRICDKEKVTELLFGNEENPRAKFIYLIDCNHIVESTGMDYWIKSKYQDLNNNDASNQIKLPECPKCKKPIRFNFRYSNIIKKQLISIEKIKFKQFGDKNENRKDKENLLEEIDEEFDEFNSMNDNLKKLHSNYLERIDHELNRTINISFNRLVAYKNSWNIFKSLKNILNSICRKIDEKESNQIEHLNYEIEKMLTRLTKNGEINLFKENGQVFKDILLEIDRISFVVEFYRLKNLAKTSKYLKDPIQILELILEIEKLLVTKINKCENQIKQTIEDHMKKLVSLLNTQSRKYEKVVIFKAIDLSQGNWFTCKNGLHIYCDCGTAMERSKCPECIQEIFRENRRLMQGNRLTIKLNGW